MPNDRVVKNPNFVNMAEFNRSLRARGVGAKDWPNTHTEVEHLEGGKFAASIGVGHRVFFDKADGNKPKKHKLTDERGNGKDYVLAQGAECCVEVHPYYAKYFDVQHEEVRLHEERWVCQRLFKEPDTWRDVGAYNPQIAVEEYSEPAGDVVKVTVTYDTDYGTLTVEYFQRDGNALKHNVYFTNTSGSTETFRVVQRWAGIVGAKVNGKDFPLVTDDLALNFRKADGKLAVAENLRSMIFNEDGSEKTDQCLKRPVSIEAHAQGMKADFIYGNWVLAQNEILEIDPDTATLDNPTEDGAVKWDDPAAYTRETICLYGSQSSVGSWLWDWRAYVEWDISSLVGGTLTANPLFKYEGSTANSATDGEINPLTEEAPSEATDANLYAYMATGTAYVTPFNAVVAENQSQDLGASAKTALQGAIDAEQSWFALGFQCPGEEGKEDDGYFTDAFKSEEETPTPPPTLYVEYEPAPPEDEEPKHTFRLHPRPGHRMEFQPNLKLG